MASKKYWDVVIFLACSIPTGYYVHYEMSSFISNEDVASIAYRKFNQEEGREYPQYTLCFKNPNGLDIHVPFERIVKQLPKNHTFRGKWVSQEIITSMTLTYKDANRICYTKNVSFPRNIRFKRHRIHLNVTILSDTFGHLQVFVHKRNQLLRSIYSPNQIITNSGLKGGANYIFSITDVEVLRRREDSNKPCNESLTEEDAYVLGVLMEKYQCIPSYWRNLRATIKKDQTLAKKWPKM